VLYLLDIFLLHQPYWLFIRLGLVYYCLYDLFCIDKFLHLPIVAVGGVYSGIYGYEDTMNYIDASSRVETDKDKAASSLLVGASNQV
jgi:hypothetical protein